MTTIDQPGMNVTVPTERSSSKTPNVKGSNDQWKRHLEKAYFERQADAMVSADPSKQETSEDSVQNTGNAPIFSRGATDIHQSLVTAGFEQFRPISYVHSPNTVSTTHQLVGLNAYRSQPSDGGLSAGSAVQVHHGSLKPDSAQMSSSVLKLSADVWRDSFPTTSSISALKSEIGVHLVIRDSTLSSNKVRQLVGKLRQLLRTEGHELGAITLNGALLWESNDPHRSGSVKPGLKLNS